MNEAAAEHVHNHGGGAGGFISSLFETFTPRRQCMNFEADVIGLHLVSDLLIALAYFSIPVALVYVARRRPELRYNWILVLFAAFIVLCGMTHLFNVWALWQPLYRLDGVIKLLTGVVSVATAVVLWRLIPEALRLPTAAELTRRGEELERLAQERTAALEASEATLRGFYDSAPVLMGVVEPLTDGDILHVYDNRAACEFFGVGPEGTQGRRASDLGASPETIATWLGHYREADAAGRPSRFEYAFDTPGGRQWLWVSVSPLGGGPTGRKRFCYVAENVTERRAAEQELIAERGKLEAVVAGMNQGVVLLSPDGSLQAMNRAALAMHGFADEAEMLRSVADFEGLFELRDTTRSIVPLESWPASRAIRGETVTNFELEVTRRDTGRRFISLYNSAIVGEAGAGVRFAVLAINDITELREAADALRQSKGQFEQLAEFIPQLAWMARPDGHIFWYNRRWYNYTGTTPAEMEGWGWQAVHDPEILPEVVRGWKHSIDTGRPFEMTFPLRGADGQFRRFLTRVTPFKDGDEIVLWFGTNTDIEDQLRGQDERERLFREAEEGRRILQALMDHIPEGITIASAPDVSIRMVSRFGQRLVSRPTETLTGIPSSEHPERWGIYHADGVTRARPEELPLTRATLVGELVKDEEWTLLGPDGNRVPILCNAAPLRDEAGAIIGGVIAWRDITARKKAEQERERLLVAAEAARAEAEHANRMKDEFLATLSHELRTPLNAIVGWTKILRSTAIDEEDRAEGLEVIDRNAKAQAQLIEDLLDISRIISGKFALDVQRITLTEVIEGALDAVTPAAQAKGIRITKVLDSLAGPVSGDPARLQQVVWNLLTNAVKFTPRGGQVQVLLERVNSHVEISVIDSGQGIPPEFLPHVFERFRQADGSSTRRHGGLGLGLSIVKQLVEMHGGSVRAKSPGEGQGSTFVVMLPITVVHPEQPGKVRPKDAERKPSDDPCGDHHLSGLRVLVVDDEPDARNLMTRVLEDCGAEVEAAGSVVEALDLVESFRPDILVSDVGMPEQDGYDLMRQVRRRLTSKELPAAALTAFARSEDRMRAMRAGFQVHVAKPVNPEELVAVVATLAGRTGGAGEEG